MRRPSVTLVKILSPPDLTCYSSHSLLLLEQSQKITASVYYAFDPDGFPDRTKQNHIPPHHRHARALADFRPQLVEQWVLPNPMD